MSCRYHLLLDVAQNGHLKINCQAAINGDDIDLSAMPYTCALDVAAIGDHTQSEVAGMLSVQKQRVDQIEKAATAKLRRKRSAIVVARLWFDD